MPLPDSTVSAQNACERSGSPIALCFRSHRRLLATGVLLASVALSGCSHFKAKPSDKYVYLTAKQTYLRDRVAAVSNRTGTANNGEKLVVLERARRFLKVRTPRGEVGWVEEKLTADQGTADQFEALQQAHEKDPVVANATARDEVYLHVAPGRDTERFFRLAEGDSLNLLQRATVEKSVPAGSAPAKAVTATVRPILHGHVSAPSPVAPTGPPPPVMEDWWLVRDSKGQTGWIYSHMIDVTAPDTLARYAEGQRIVGAYILAHADDPESGILDNGQTVTSIPEYVTVLSPYQAGLPYDFNQVRVFIWNTKKHRYETGFREHNIAGYLPVTIGTKTDPYGKTPLAMMSLPTFTYKVLAEGATTPLPDPKTGEMKPAQTITKTYRLEGNQCRRLLPPNTTAPAEAHPDPEPEKKSKRRR